MSNRETHREIHRNAANLAMLYRMKDAAESVALEEMRSGETYYFTNTPAQQVARDARQSKQIILQAMRVADAILLLKEVS